MLFISTTMKSNSEEAFESPQCCVSTVLVHEGEGINCWLEMPYNECLPTSSWKAAIT